VSGPGVLTVGSGVITEMVRLAALEVPGVLRVGHAGPAWRNLLRGRSISTRVTGSSVDVRISIIARPGHALGPLTAQVRTAVGATIERMLRMELGDVTVLVDGVGA
jgi:uncharacterized alkaline shock family protein YloU